MSGISYAFRKVKRINFRAEIIRQDGVKGQRGVRPLFASTSRLANSLGKRVLETTLL